MFFTTHYKNASMQYTAIFHGCKTNNFQTKKIDNFLSEAVLTSTHNQCFRTKVKKKVYPCKPQFYYMKEGCNGVNITWTCLHDVTTKENCSTSTALSPSHYFGSCYPFKVLSRTIFIRITCPCDIDPLNSLLLVKLWFTGV